jgi:hypothetical protein
MPNHVFHTLKIAGPEAEIERFLSECFTPDDEKGPQFDFDRIVPEPEHEPADPERIRRGYDLMTSTKTPSGPVMVTVTDEAMELTTPPWMAWRCEHWGDKWNAKDAGETKLRRFESGAVELKFDTAWSPPVPIFEAIAERFPELEIAGDFIDGQYNWSGEVHIVAGDVRLKDTTEENEAIAHYRAVCDEGEKELHADLLKHLAGAPNVFAFPTLGWHWAKAAEKLVAEDPGLTDPSRAEELLRKAKGLPEPD